MAKVIPVQDFLLTAADIIVDVRSPAEYAQGHIPGAINIPLFSNEERAEVGTLYKQVGKEEAIERGLEIVGPKMARWVKEAKVLSAKRKIAVYCWRGGMRSGSFSWLMRTAGFEVDTLAGGYKAYRNYVLAYLAQPLPFVVLGGETGSGKTDILLAIREMGEQVIDLEGLAFHKGSAFGGLDDIIQPTSEQFENNLVHELVTYDLTRRIWIEDESRNIGKVYMPTELWQQKHAAPIVKVNVPQSVRVERLVVDYGAYPIDKLKAAVLKISKRLGGLATKQCLAALDEGDLTTVAQLTLYYYDKSYSRGLEDKKEQVLCEVHCESGDPVENGRLVMSFFSEK